MSIRMTEDEIEMLRTVIRTSSNCPTARLVQRSGGYKSESTIRALVPNQHTANPSAELAFEPFVPDVEAGADAAAKMLMFMGLEKYPLRAATFFDYIAMAYEFGKQNRWN
jgi:hypothetical protein